MKKMELFNDGETRCTIEVEGNIITLTQEEIDVEANAIILYDDEFEKAYQFIQQAKQQQ